MPEKMYSAYRHKMRLDKQEYFCELMYVRTKWVFKIARLFIFDGRFFEVGVFVYEQSVYVGCLYFGRPVGYGVEFTKLIDDHLASFVVEADFTSPCTFQFSAHKSNAPVEVVDYSSKFEYLTSEGILGGARFRP